MCLRVTGVSACYWCVCVLLVCLRVTGLSACYWCVCVLTVDALMR